MAQAPSRSAGAELTLDFRRYLASMGSTRDVLLNRYRGYSEMFDGAARVADVACGSGEFLELMRSRGIDARGVDNDGELVGQARTLDLPAEQGEATGFLRAHPASFDGVFMPHLLERLEPPAATAVLEAACGALSPGGRLLVVSRNPQNLAVQLGESSSDLRHVRFYSAEILRWALHQLGLGEVRSGENSDYVCGPTIANSTPPVLPVPQPVAPRPAPALGWAARARQRLGEWMVPAVLLERVQDIEDRAQGQGHVVAAHAAELERVHAWVKELRGLYNGLYHAGEIWVTGVLQ